MAAQPAPDQTAVKRTPSGKLSWGLPPRPRSANHGERAPAAAASGAPQQRRVTSSDAPLGAPDAHPADPPRQPHTATGTSATARSGSSSSSSSSNGQPSPALLLGAPQDRQQERQQQQQQQQQQQHSQRRKSSSNVQQAECAPSDQAVLQDVLAAVTWELGTHNKDYGQGLQGILAAVRDAVARATDEVRDKAQRKGRADQEKALKEAEARMERALVELREKNEASEKKLGEKVRELQAQVVALDRDRRSVMAKAAQHRRESREASERTGAHEAAVTELESRLEKQGRAAAKAEAGWARYKADAEAQVQALQQQLEDARQELAAAQAVACSPQKGTRRQPEDQACLLDITAVVAEVLDDVATTKQLFSRAMEGLTDEQASLRDVVKRDLQQFQTAARTLAEEGRHHAQRCAAEISSQLSACNRLGALGFDDVNSLIEKLSQLKHQVKEMAQQQVQEKELQAQRDKQWQKDIASRDSLKDENQKLDSTLTLTRATLAAVRQQNENYSSLIAALRKETADAVAAARAAQQDLDKAAKAVSERERRLQAAAEALQQAHAQLRDANEQAQRHRADREAAAAAAAEETGALVQHLVLHLRGWFFHTEPAYPAAKSPPASPIHPSSCAASPARGSPTTRPTSALPGARSQHPPSSTQPVPNTTSTAAFSPGMPDTPGTPQPPPGGPHSLSAICRLDHDGLMAAFAAFLARSRTLGLAGDPATPAADPQTADSAPTNDPLSTTASAVQFVADLLLGVPPSATNGDVRRSVRLASGRHASVAGNMSDFMQTLVQADDEEGTDAAAGVSPLQFLSKLFKVNLPLDPARTTSSTALGQPTLSVNWQRASSMLGCSLGRHCTQAAAADGEGDGRGGEQGAAAEGQWWVVLAGELVRLEGCVLTVLMELRLREGQLAEVRQQLAEATALLQIKKLQQWPKSSAPLPPGPHPATTQPSSSQPPPSPASPSSPAAALNAQLVRSLAAEKKALAQKLRCLEAGGGPPPRDRLLPTGSRPSSARNWATAGPSTALGVMALGAARPTRPVSAQPSRPPAAGALGDLGGGDAIMPGAVGSLAAFTRFSDGGSPTRSSEFQEIFAVLDLLDGGCGSISAAGPLIPRTTAPAPVRPKRPASALQAGTQRHAAGMSRPSLVPCRQAPSDTQQPA